MTFLSFLGGLNAWLLTLAALVGSVTAFRGLNTWKSQITWETDHKLARGLLKLLFQHRDAIATVRHPAIFSAEAEAAVKDQEDDKGGRSTLRFREIVAVYEKRWERISEVRSELYPMLLEADVLWGSEPKDLVKPIFDLELELRIVIQTYLRSISPTNSKDAKRAASNSLRKRRDIMYDILTEDDEFRADYETALEPVEMFLRGKLGHKK